MMEDFYHNFKQDEKSLQEAIGSASTKALSGSERARILEESRQGISELSDRVKAASGHLPLRDLKSYNSVINSLKDQLRNARQASSSRRRFVFEDASLLPPTAIGSTGVPVEPASGIDLGSLESKQVAGVGHPIEEEAAASVLDIENPTIQISDLTATICSKDYSTPTLPSTVDITNVKDSFVELLHGVNSAGNLAALMVSKVDRSVILIDSVSGASHITELSNSVLLIKSRQLRMHKCRDCVMYLDCRSKPVLEDCAGMKFAPMPHPSKGSEGIEPPNLWDQVEDFNWLKSDPSPNWSVLSSEDIQAIEKDSLGVFLDGKASELLLADILKRARVN